MHYMVTVLTKQILALVEGPFDRVSMTDDLSRLRKSVKCGGGNVQVIPCTTHAAVGYSHNDWCISDCRWQVNL